MSWIALRRAQTAVASVRLMATQVKPAKMFDKILIANRGEIACRVMRTARKLGVKTVAVFSDADAKAMHVRMADEAIHIGPSPSSESYLKMQTILDVAKATGAQAIHPGYGFLSENAIFAEMCAKQGIVFIGPPASAIRDMGSKSESKNIMQAAGVPLISGYHGEDQSLERLRQAAEEIKYPVLVKAVMGGGGKGMRIVRKAADLLSDLQSAQQEARRSFGDSRVLIEKYVERPRHVEVQVFADTFGNTVYLYERDCSVQRRHQKIIEESPAPHLSDDLRHHFGRTAVTAAKAVNYVGAGTVEFLMDTDTNEYYFMEMNTRLQVEHPVTEMVTGTDLVEWQLLAASGFPLPKTQEQIAQTGHAFEARIYAENPAKGFIPGAGPLTYLRTPQAREDIRIETGIEQGDAVSVFYDPMISKLVVWGPDRRTALAKLDHALSEYNICGLHTNIDFLRQLANHETFRDGHVSTKFIEEHYDALFPARHPLSNKRAVAQAILAILLKEQEKQLRHPNIETEANSPWASHDGKRLNDTLNRNLTLQAGEDEKLVVNVTYATNGSYLLKWKGQAPVTVRGSINSSGKLVAYVDEKLDAINVAIIGGNITLFTPEGQVEFSVPAPEFLKAAEHGSGDRIVSPTTGTIEEILVPVGAVVEKNQPLIKMESMKMLQILRAPRAGVVSQINKSKGDFVADSEIILELEPVADKEEKKEKK